MENTNFGGLTVKQWLTAFLSTTLLSFVCGRFPMVGNVQVGMITFILTFVIWLLYAKAARQVLLIGAGVGRKAVVIILSLVAAFALWALTLSIGGSIGHLANPG